MHKATSDNPKENVTDEALKARVLLFIKTHGEPESVRLLATPRHTLARVAAGLRVRPATLYVVRAELDKHAPVGAVDAPKGKKANK
jgi:hypothetical protein